MHTQVARAKSCANHMQHIKRFSCATCPVPRGAKGQLSYQFGQSWNRIYFSCILLAETIYLWRRGGNQSTRRKPLTTSFRFVLVRLLLVMTVVIPVRSLCRMLKTARQSEATISSFVDAVYIHYLLYVWHVWDFGAYKTNTLWRKGGGGWRFPSPSMWVTLALIEGHWEQKTLFCLLLCTFLNWSVWSLIWYWSD